MEDALEQAFSPSGAPLSVIITLREPPAGAPRFEARRAAIARVQDDVVSAQADGFVVTRRYGSIPVLAARLTKAALDRIRRHPAVTRVQRDGTGHGQLNVAVPFTGADKVKSVHGLTGQGVRVALLDTGVDTTHPDLSDSIAAQHCFTQYDCPPLRTTEGTSAEDDHGHGSNVAGIVTSKNSLSFPQLRALEAVDAVCFPDGGAPLADGGVVDAGAAGPARAGPSAPDAASQSTGDDGGLPMAPEGGSSGSGALSGDGIDASVAGDVPGATEPTTSNCACNAVGATRDRGETVMTLGIASLVMLRRRRRRTTPIANRIHGPCRNALPRG